MPKLATAVGFIAVLGLTGCSSTMRTYVDTLQLAFNQGADVSLSNEQLANRRTDALYATVGGLPRAQLELMYVEHGQYKWRSADNAMLILQHGRLVKTTGFTNDLLFMTALQDDPLKQNIAAIQPGQQWQAYTDWAVANETGYPVQFVIKAVAEVPLELLNQQFSTKRVTEQVTFANGDSANNEFWFDLQSGSLLKSKQQIAPFWPSVELIHISTAARLAGIVAQGSNQ